jgi:hypothetical protein
MDYSLETSSYNLINKITVLSQLPLTKFDDIGNIANVHR